jgi:serine-type D-Ala-D-Ala carboxypeptidase
MRMTAGDVAREIVSAGVAPDCAAGCASRREPRTPKDDPRAADAPHPRLPSAWMQEVGGATTLFFDLASITKPMTAVAIAMARIDRHTPLGGLLPEARGTPSERVTIEQLLAHRAGLERHRDLHAPLLRGQSVEPSRALREAALARRADAVGVPPEEGFPPVYSDLGYVLVGAALARAVAARDAGEAIARLVLEPLGVTHRSGTVRELAARGIRGPFAPTEDVVWRGGRVCGAVHDENAWALTQLGGSGHAGIFATVDAVLAFGGAVLDALDGFASALGDVDLGWLVRERVGGTLRAGFDGKSVSGSSAGELFGARSFGHLGFTGTSLWLDPDAHTVVALLTNRVCPTREHLAIRESRPVAHDTLWARARQLAAHASIAAPPGEVQHESI